MIVIGSYAASLQGISMGRPVADLDLIGSLEELQRFRHDNHPLIAAEQALHGHRARFRMKPEAGYAKVEFDHEQSASDRLLEELCQKEVPLLSGSARLPSPTILYLTKRAHANVPVSYAKTIADLITLKPHYTQSQPEESRYYELRKKECQERYALNRQRFSLAVSNEEFFTASDHIRVYEHDDIHLAVAHDPGQPLFRRCKRDLTLARIDRDLFEQLTPADQLKMVQEEFMVIGLERFFVHNPTLTKQEVYERGMHKTIRDLFVGYFQDFCIDHADELVEAPDLDFVERFRVAVAEGRIRRLSREVAPINNTHQAIARLILEEQFTEARKTCEDMIRRSQHGNDPHAFFLLGLILMRQEAYAGAIRSFRACVLRDPSHALGWFRLGSLLRAAKQPIEALRCLQTASQLQLANPSLQLEIGKTHAALADRRRAVNAFRQAMGSPQVAEEAKRELTKLNGLVTFRENIEIRL